MTTAAARLDLRLNPADKARITRAADLRGVPLSAFVRDAVLREAESVIADEVTVSLSPEESRRFLRSLDAPFQPNAKLKKAMERGLTLAIRPSDSMETLAAKQIPRKGSSLAKRLRGRATTRMSTDDIMKLTRSA